MEHKLGSATAENKKLVNAKENLKEQLLTLNVELENVKKEIKAK